jgi:hypothetical protein
MSKSQTSITDTLKTIEGEIEKIVMSPKIPGLPDNVKEFIVKFSPWFAVISMLMLAPLILAAFGLSSLALPFSYLGGLRMGFSYTLNLVFSFGLIVLELMAIPGLFKRKESAWRLMFYSTLISLTQQLFSLNLGGLILGGAVSFYLLFQVKSKYTK